MIAGLWNDRSKAILRLSLVCAVIIVLSGTVLKPLQSGAWNEIKAQRGDFNLSELSSSLGQGIIFGVLGGFRNIAADIAWLRADHFWRKNESAATEAWIYTTLTIDPRPRFFWTNSARILALDMPAWEIRANGGWGKVPQTVQERTIREHALKGIKVLDKALELYPDSYDFLIDKARLYQHRLRDNENASKYYLEASKIPGSPYYIKEIYANILCDMGRFSDAREYLISIEEDVPEYFREDIKTWINELSRALE